MKTSTSEVEKNAPKITKLIILTKGFSQAWSAMKRLRFMVEEVVGKSKGMTTNIIGFGVELNSKNSKVWSCKIKMVVRANKMAHP